MDFEPHDIRVDTIHRAEGVCSVRVTHLPTGVRATADDGRTIDENKRRAFEMLREQLAQR